MSHPWEADTLMTAQTSELLVSPQPQGPQHGVPGVSSTLREKRAVCGTSSPSFARTTLVPSVTNDRAHVWISGSHGAPHPLLTLPHPVSKHHDPGRPGRTHKSTWTASSPENNREKDTEKPRNRTENGPRGHKVTE